ncbi:peptide deformylase [bacterium]
MILGITLYPNDILRKKCRKVQTVGHDEQQLFNDMLEVMKPLNGVGLAAPQVGMDLCIIVADIGEGEIKLANPEIIEKQGISELEEGCLSLPQQLCKINRAEHVVVKGLNEKNKIVTIKASGMLSHVLQHEIDHLNGKLIIDY